MGLCNGMSPAKFQTCRTYGTRDMQNPNFGVSWGRPYIVEEKSYRKVGLGLRRVRVCESTVPYPRLSDPWEKCAASGHDIQKALERPVASGDKVKRMCRFRAQCPKSPGAACGFRSRGRKNLPLQGTMSEKPWSGIRHQGKRVKKPWSGMRHQGKMPKMPWGHAASYLHETKHVSEHPT